MTAGENRREVSCLGRMSRLVLRGRVSSGYWLTQTCRSIVGQRVIDSFVLASVHGGTKLEFRGAIPRGLEGYDGTSFVAALVGHPVSASVDVYDIQPHRWSRLFHDMAENWRGWHGAKTQESLEGHLRMSCTSDGLGHVTIRVYLRGDMTGADWRGEDSIYLEAGQLDEIARAAREYFG